MEEVPEGMVVRPAPEQPIVDRIRAWLNWFGVARLVVSAVSVVVVCGGAYWLVRSPSPPAEAVLPLVTSPHMPTSTLAVPDLRKEAAVADGLASEILVHVAGAVVRPGVYRMADGGRVDDAVRLAGGPTTHAELDALNLAAPVVDGVRVYVPADGETVPGPASPSMPDEIGSVGPLDINRADTAMFDTLPGIGPATAEAIVVERDRNGPFLGIDDLERVPGIGPAKLAALRDLVTA